MRKILIGVLVLIVLVAGGLFFYARAILASDAVRTTLEAQISKALGQPVSIGSIDATIFPRVTVRLGTVGIGQPARIQARTLDIGTSLGALLSRRIENATLRLDGARIQMPLPEFNLGTTPSAEPSEPSVQIVSVDEIVLSDVEIVSGGRTLKGNIEAQLQGQGLTLRRVSLGAGGTTIEASGAITDFAGPTGELQVKAGVLNLDDLMAFGTEFSSGMAAPPGGAPPPAAPAARPSAAPTPASRSTMNIKLSLEADRATMGALSLDKLSGRALVTGDTVTLEPISFGVFGGRYEGGLSASLAGAAPSFKWNATLTNIDVAAATTFAGSPNTVSGRLTGKIDLAGSGADAAAAMRTVRGKARLDVTNGIVKNLGLVRTVIVATSMRADAVRGGGSNDEPFSRLGGTLVIGGGVAATDDLLFESENLRLAAAGRLNLDGSAMNLAGKVQLSETLTAEAGRDLVRYTQEQGRVTLPATITGPAASPTVRIDTADMAKRAISNRANEEAQKAMQRGLGGLIRR